MNEIHISSKWNGLHDLFTTIVFGTFALVNSFVFFVSIWKCYDGWEHTMFLKSPKWNMYFWLSCVSKKEDRLLCVIQQCLLWQSVQLRKYLGNQIARESVMCESNKLYWASVSLVVYQQELISQCLINRRRRVEVR